MNRTLRETRSLVDASVFCALAAVHLIDEVQWGAPAEFNLSLAAILLLAFLFMLALIAITGAEMGLGAQSLRYIFA